MLDRMVTRTEAADRLSPLRSRWCSLSQTMGWPRKEDWWTPAVDALLDAFGGYGADSVAASERLGRERAWGSVGLSEALTDLRAGLQVLRVPARNRAALSGALASGWADEVAGWLGRAGVSCRDTLTELSTREYLSTRLGELYAESAADGAIVTDRKVLVAVSVRTSTAPLVTEQRMVRVGQVLASVFTRGQTLARVGAGVAAALADRDERLNDLLLNLQLELSWTGLSAQPVSARTWLEPLPAESVYLTDLLDDLGRC